MPYDGVDGSSGGWNTYQGDAGRTGYVGGGAPTGEPKKPPWTGASERVAPAVAYGAVFAVTQDNRVVAYDVETGDQLWEHDVEGNTDSSPAVADGRVFVATTDAGTVYALDAATGEVDWEYTVEGRSSYLHVDATPTVHDGTVFFGGRGSVEKLHALDAETGEEEFVFETERDVESPVLAHDGWVYVGDAGGTLYAINLEWEIDEWTFEQPMGEFEHAPVGADDRIFVVEGSDLYALDAEDGEELWHSYDFHRGAPSVVDGVVYSATDDGLRAFDADSGEQLWIHETDSRTRSTPAVADGIVYVGCNDETLKALDADTGDLVWEYGADDQVQAGPVVADGAVFVAQEAFDETLLALTPGADPIEPDASVAGGDVRTAGEDADAADDGADAVDDGGDAADDDSEDDDAVTDPTITGPLSVEGEWPTAQGVPTRTGYAGGGAPRKEPKKPPWTAEAITESPPAVAYGAVFVATSDPSVCAYDIETGDRLWDTDLGGRLAANPAVAEGRAFVGTRDGIFYALDAATGEVEWQLELEGEASMFEVNATPTVDDGVVYVTGRGNGMLYALDVETGETEWTFEAGYRYVESTPVVHDDWVYFGDGGEAFYAINTEYEVDEWTFEPAMPEFDETPAAAGDTVFVIDGSDLYALDAKSGEEQWHSYDFHRGSPTVVDGVVYSATDDGLRAFDAGSGEQLWIHETDDRPRSVAYAEGILYVGTADGPLKAIDADSADLIWEYDTEGIETEAVVADGAVFAVENGHDDPLYALTELADDVEPSATVSKRDIRAEAAAADDGDDDAPSDDAGASSDASDGADAAADSGGEAEESDDEEIADDDEAVTEPDGEYTTIAVESIDDPEDPTDEELQAVILGSIADEWLDGTREVRLNSNAVEEAVAGMVPGATGGLVFHNLEQLADRGYFGWENKNRYYLITSRPEGIHRYEELTGEEILAKEDLLAVLEPLYERKRRHPRDPALTRDYLQEEVDLSEDELDRMIWYLDSIGKWITDVLLVKGSTGYVDTRAMGSGPFWHEAELNEAGSEFYDQLTS